MSNFYWPNISEGSESMNKNDKNLPSKGVWWLDISQCACMALRRAVFVVIGHHGFSGDGSTFQGAKAILNYSPDGYKNKNLN